MCSQSPPFFWNPSWTPGHPPKKNIKKRDHYDIYDSHLQKKHKAQKNVASDYDLSDFGIEPSFFKEFFYLVVSTHLKHMLVKLDHFPRDRGENTKYLKPPPRSLPLSFDRAIKGLFLGGCD